MIDTLVTIVILLAVLAMKTSLSQSASRHHKDDLWWVVTPHAGLGGRLCAHVPSLNRLMSKPAPVCGREMLNASPPFRKPIVGG
jgi:hypothetical protein